MLYFLTTHNWEKMCLEALAFKMAIKVWAWKPEVEEKARFSMVDIVINHNHR